MKSIIFDLDGTLLYTLEDINDAINFALLSFNLRPNSIEETRKFVGNGAKTLVLRSMYHRYDVRLFLKNTLFDQIYSLYMEKYLSIRLNKTKPYDGIVDVLNELKSKGYNLAVLSNKPARDTTAIINNYFNNIFDIVLGSNDNYNLKPDPTLLNHIISYFGTNKENVIYVGDSLVDILTARNANVKCISVSYGYNDKDILLKDNNVVIDNPYQLLEAIK